MDFLEQLDQLTKIRDAWKLEASKMDSLIASMMNEIEDLKSNRSMLANSIHNLNLTIDNLDRLAIESIPDSSDGDLDLIDDEPFEPVVSAGAVALQYDHMWQKISDILPSAAVACVDDEPAEPTLSGDEKPSEPSAAESRDKVGEKSGQSRDEVGTKSGLTQDKVGTKSDSVPFSKPIQSLNESEKSIEREYLKKRKATAKTLVFEFIKKNPGVTQSILVANLARDCRASSIPEVLNNAVKARTIVRLPGSKLYIPDDAPEVTSAPAAPVEIAKPIDPQKPTQVISENSHMSLANRINTFLSVQGRSTVQMIADVVRRSETEIVAAIEAHPAFFEKHGDRYDVSAKHRV